MKSSQVSDRFYTTLTCILVLVTIIGGVWTTYDQDQKHTEDKVSSLLPRNERAVRDYAKMTSKLRPGDLVLVRNHDNLESGRYLHVTQVRDGSIRLESKYDAVTKEVLVIEDSLKVGLRLNSKYAFRPLYQNSETAADRAEFLCIASWFYGV